MRAREVEERGVAAVLELVGETEGFDVPVRDCAVFGESVGDDLLARRLCADAVELECVHVPTGRDGPYERVRQGP